VIGRLFGSKAWQALPTWAWELLVVWAILSVAAWVGGASGLQWLSTAAVLLTFAHVQVATRLEEAEARRTRVSVHCRRWLTRYLVAKESLWVVLFAVTGAWPAVAGCAVFLLYPSWRALYRRHRPGPPRVPGREAVEDLGRR
jgi:hypothetical protein